MDSNTPKYVLDGSNGRVSVFDDKVFLEIKRENALSINITELKEVAVVHTNKNSGGIRFIRHCGYEPGVTDSIGFATFSGKKGKELNELIDKIGQFLNEKIQQNIDNGLTDYSNSDKTVIRKKCNICGHIFCYSQIDLAINNGRERNARWASLSGAASALTGQYAASAVYTGNAQDEINRIVDYSRCPKCNSTDLRTLSKEEFQNATQLENISQTSAPAVSSADELKKFKELLDDGVISQDEFDAKKKQLLGL